MILSMDLNASSLPEEAEQPMFEQFAADDAVVEETQESAVETMRREREERRQHLKLEKQAVGQKRPSQPPKNDYMPPSRNVRRCGRIKQLPQGWLNCPSYGQCIEFLIPSKVPLDETFNDSILPGKRYSPKQIIHQQKRNGREIGLVIDLTNTSRYYQPSEWIKQGIKQVKIACKGREAVPDNDSVNIFVHEVMQFLTSHVRNKKYILVHCTHGHNRTGFMIVHFLTRTMGSSVAEAINRFAQARPPGIYKQDYIEALYTLHHEVPENKMVCPSTPEWKRSSDLDLNGEAVVDDNGEGDSAAATQEQVEIKTITNNDILGDAIPDYQQESLRQICYQLFDLAHTGRGNAQFPGSHPVSLNRDNLQLLRQRFYYATWKADGTRYMMLITTHGCYLIDRNFCFRRVQMRFPLKNFNEGFHNYTLIDGEMIIDKIPDSGLKRRYLAYDMVAHHSKSVVKLPFAERWKMLEDEVIRPRNYERKQFDSEGRGNPVYRYGMEPFGVRRKDFWLLSTVTKLLKEFIPKLSHESDGLIFQGWHDPYVPRTHEGLLKWKYPSMNSVDFLFEVGSEGRQMLYVNERGKTKLLDGAHVVLGDECEDTDDITSLSGKIIECSLNKETGSWMCMRVRTDKSTPNDINTFRKVMRSINDNITEDVLLEEIGQIVRLPMYAEKIAKAHQLHRSRVMTSFGFQKLIK